MTGQQKRNPENAAFLMKVQKLKAQSSPDGTAKPVTKSQIAADKRKAAAKKAGAKPDPAKAVRSATAFNIVSTGSAEKGASSSAPVAAAAPAAAPASAGSTTAVAVAEGASQEVAATKQRSKLLIALAALGPGIVTAMAGNDAGGISTYSTVGAQFGYATLWVIPVMCILLIVVEMTAS